MAECCNTVWDEERSKQKSEYQQKCYNHRTTIETMDGAKVLVAKIITLCFDLVWQ